MSGARRSAAPAVFRAYRPELDACLRALTLLLKQPVSNEGSPTLATFEDTRGDAQNGSRAKPILPR
jgi:hypothetical protein